MTPRRGAQAVPVAAEVGEESRLLGEALASRVGDCLRICEERMDALNLAVRSDRYRTQRRTNLTMGAELMARWLQTGEESTPEERRILGSLGEEAARNDLSIVQMTRGHLIFRDVVAGILREEGERLGTPVPVLEMALRMNAASCDASVLWMTKLFDRQKERTAAALAASEARFRGVFESMATAVLVTDAHGTVVSCNEAAAEMLESPADGLLGVNICTDNPSYSDERGNPLRRTPVAEVIATGEPVHGMVVRHDFGAGRPPRWHQVDAIPIRGPDGELVQVLTTFSDVTAVKRAEELRAESEAKNRFLATMSHELRTPLNSILGFTQLLGGRGGELEAQQKRYLGNIESSGKQLLALINDILELSRAASGQVVMAPEDAELAPIVRQVASEFEPMLARQPVELRLDLQPGLKARIDVRRFHQVLVNLVANALKFTEQGSITVCSGRQELFVEVCVIDTGIGIPADQLERVFDEFTQVDGGSTRARGGTGLGLPLSRRLVEMMGGTLKLESALGEGTRAIVRLPLSTT